MAKPAPAIIDESNIPQEGNNPRFRPEEFQDVRLARTWLKPGEDQAPVAMLLLGRTPNVRELFPSQLPGQQDQPCYVWGCETLADMPIKNPATHPFWEGDKPIALMAGELFYFFEPIYLRDIMAKCFQNQWPIWVRSVGLEKHPNPQKARLGFRSRKWEVKKIERPLKSLVGINNVILPSAGNTLMLAENAGDYEG